jgi:hypothetical protein
MLTDVSEAMSIALMMEAVHTFETSVNIYLTTWQYIPEDSELHCNVLLFYILYQNSQFSILVLLIMWVLRNTFICIINGNMFETQENV